ncbi:unnamed protein product [Euphydryas editha]|uniref:snRNA-activating protein complex subunit 1 n=1 Tax=Euphydryas editha TaxID=104508 RepID=A0AAU9UL33_EUPED|nr:unnamed protein product [Euphydryas editha]
MLDVIPGYSHHIYQVHIADGFSNDCDELIHRCLQLQTLNYEAFCTIWKDMNFGMIYQGRSSGAEIAEVSEEVIYIAKSYMVKDTDNFEESVAGVFLVYGLLTLQPFRGFASLRIVPDDVQCINRIEVVARRERRLDVLYILGEILIKHTQYHAAERDRGMESVVRKYLEGYTSIDKLGVRPRGVFFRQNEELDIIRDLGSITRQYALAKKSLIGANECDSNLQYINENLATELNTSLKRIINGLIDDDPNDKDDDDGDDDEEVSVEHYDTVQAIKTKAMSNTVNPIQHLTGIEERKPINKSPKKKSDLKAPTGKVKSGSPTKPIANSPKKPKTEPKSRKKKAKETKSRKETDMVGSADLNIDDFQKGKAFDVSKVNDVQIDENNLKIDSLPSKLQTEGDGHLIEIEIIDYATKSNNGNEEHTNNIVEISEADNKPSKRKCKDSIVKQRNYKRPKLKSKFKKMGMLPVANFKEQK